MRGQETNGNIVYLRVTSLSPECQQQLLGDKEDLQYGLIPGCIRVLQKEAADGPETWLAFTPQASGTKLKATPLTSKIIELTRVEFPAYQALDRLCVEPSPLSRVISF